MPERIYLPEELFGTNVLGSLKGISILILGGFLVGFGTRYAGGCTSGHAISGLSNLQIPSLIAVIGFFIGGLIMTFFLISFNFLDYEIYKILTRWNCFRNYPCKIRSCFLVSYL